VRQFECPGPLTAMDLSPDAGKKPGARHLSGEILLCEASKERKRLGAGPTRIASISAVAADGPDLLVRRGRTEFVDGRGKSARCSRAFAGNNGAGHRTRALSPAGQLRPSHRQHGGKTVAVWGRVAGWEIDRTAFSTQGDRSGTFPATDTHALWAGSDHVGSYGNFPGRLRKRDLKRRVVEQCRQVLGPPVRWLPGTSQGLTRRRETFMGLPVTEPTSGKSLSRGKVRESTTSATRSFSLPPTRR